MVRISKVVNSLIIFIIGTCLLSFRFVKRFTSCDVVRICIMLSSKSLTPTRCIIGHVDLFITGIDRNTMYINKKTQNFLLVYCGKIFYGERRKSFFFFFFFPYV